ncbi:MAG: TonB family protein [Chitinivibrionales bacterium]|nr:TonB family protein [Chitinivibrionales bacterium]
MKTFAHISIIILLIVISVGFNAGLVDVRMAEIKHLIGKITVDEDASQTFGIVAKYELIRRRMLYGEEDIENYELEAKVAALTASSSGDKAELDEKSWIKAPIRGVLGAIRFCLGKEQLDPDDDNEIARVLEIGYFWERNRKYPEAIKIYNEVLEMPGVSAEIKSAVMAHKAFCHSMLSEYSVSKDIYEHVINTYPTTQAGVLSWKLLDFIESMEQERLELQEKNLSDFEKAKQFYLVMDYRNAIKYFSRYLQQNHKGRQEWEARYFKGRVHEEIGETDEAVAEYYKVIRNNKKGKWSRQANRRMIMLGEFYEHKKQIAEEARKQLQAFKDLNFISKMDRYADLVEESSLRRELLAKSRKKQEPRPGVDDSLMAMINQIGNLDLTGEKEAKRRKEIEKLRRELIDKGKLSQAELHEIERMQAIKQNPFRRPTALKKVIDRNSSQLKYLYDKRLRRGQKLSGRMEVSIKIRADGSVAQARPVKTDIGDSSFEQQVIDRIRTWRFAAVPDSLGDLTVNYPFEFYEGY